ncbi:MAG: hypothetical protein P1U89_26145 [Verrucomicrobiales bacterium]|nr:hypothetical protein [Verrucomicrobiales bacterium]
MVLAGLTALVFGCFFWNFAINGRLDDPILVASFVVYAFAYLLNFSFGINNSMVLGADRLDGFYYSLTFSRVVHMISSWAFLSFGWGIWGLSVSFLLSVAVSVSCIGRIAGALRKGFDKSRVPVESGGRDKGIWKFSLYSFMAFWVYRGVVLGVAFLGIEANGLTDYLFTLNLLSMAALLSMIPFQVRLPLLVRLIADQKSTGKELIKLLALSVGVFLVFGLGLYVFALLLRNFSEASFGLLDSGGYLLLMGALLLEVVLGGLALYFATIEKFTFVLPYTVSVLLGSMIGMFLYSKHQSYIYLILIPALTQILVALPLIGRNWFGIRRLRLN